MLRTFNKNWAVLDLLADFILSNTEGDIFEIGYGRSSKILNKYAYHYGRIHLICDTNKKKVDKATKHFKNISTYIGRSLDYIKKLSDFPIAIGMIDGEHIYETVMVEFDWIFERLSKNGMIFIHDTYPSKEEWVTDNNKFSGNVYKVRQELEKRDDLQIFTWPYGAAYSDIECGLSMVMKKESNRPFYRE